MIYNQIMKFSSNTETIIDSFTTKQAEFLLWDYSNGDHVILQDTKSGSFYRLYCDKNELELDIQFQYQRVYNTNYQKLEGGDVYACVPYTSDEKSIIVNLTQQQVIQEFDRNLITFIILKEN